MASILFALWGCLILVIRVYPTSAQGSEADVAVNQAILDYEAGRYDDALRLLRETLTSDPNHVEALYLVGLIRMAQNQFDPAIVALERARQLAPRDLAIVFNLGVAYFALEQYDKAEPLLTEVFTAEPTRENLGYYVGFMRYRRKDYQGALDAFSAGRSTDPNLQQLTRFYKSLALTILGRPEQAVAELDEASRIRTVSPLTGPADRLRDTIVAAKERERRFHAQIRLGAYYDTNVRALPLDDPTNTVVTAIRSRTTNSPGELTSARFDYSFIRSGPWEAAASYSFFQTWNNRVPSFNVQNHLGQVAGVYNSLIGKMPFQLSTQYSFDTTSLGGTQFLNRNSGSISATLVENDRHLTVLQGRVQEKQFFTNFQQIDLAVLRAENRNATNWMGGLTHVFRFEQDRHLLRIGYQYDKENAKGGDWEYRGNRFLAGAQYTLPWQDLRINYDFDIYLRYYPTPNSLFPPTAPNTVKQNVTEQNHVLRLQYPLPHDLTLSLDYQVTISRSNLPEIFNYNRQVGTVSLFWVY